MQQIWFSQLFGFQICSKTYKSTLIATRGWSEQFYQSVARIYPIWSECSVKLMAPLWSHKNSTEGLNGGRKRFREREWTLCSESNTDVALNTPWSCSAPLHISNGQLRADVIFFLCPALSTYFTLKINWIYNPLSGGRLLSLLQVPLVAVMFYHLICVQWTSMNSDCWLLHKMVYHYP